MQDEFTKDEDMITIGEAAKFTGLSIDTLRRWEKRGKIVAHRSPGGHRYFSKKELSNASKKRYKRDAPKPAATKHAQEMETKKSYSDTASTTVPQPTLHPHQVPTPPYHQSATYQSALPEKDKKFKYSHRRKHLTPSSVLDKDKQLPPRPVHEVATLSDQTTNTGAHSISQGVPELKHKTSTHIVQPTPNQKHTGSVHSDSDKVKTYQINKSSKQLSKYQILIYGAFVAFLIINIILIILLRSWSVPLSPIP
jgi:excisionase family DNA binding protein